MYDDDPSDYFRGCLLLLLIVVAAALLLAWAVGRAGASIIPGMGGN